MCIDHCDMLGATEKKRNRRKPTNPVTNISNNKRDKLPQAGKYPSTPLFEDRIQDTSTNSYKSRRLHSQEQDKAQLYQKVQFQF